jgi:hypothetical protein
MHELDTGTGKGSDYCGTDMNIDTYRQKNDGVTPGWMLTRKFESLALRLMSGPGCPSRWNIL